MVEGIVWGRRAVGAEMALKLGASFRTSPDFWLAAQRAVDLYQVTAEGIDLPPPLIEDESARAARASREKFEVALAQLPDVEPEKSDRL